MQNSKLLRVLILVLAAGFGGCTNAISQAVPTEVLTITATTMTSPTPTASPVPSVAPTGQPTDETLTSAVEFLGPTIIAKYPHDTGAYTQGLVWSGGLLYESTGRYP